MRYNNPFGMPFGQGGLPGMGGMPPMPGVGGFYGGGPMGGGPMGMGGGPMGGGAPPPPSMGFQMPTFPGSNAIGQGLRGIGDFLGRAGGWMAENPSTMAQLIGAGASIYGTHRAAREAEKMREEERRREDEARERHDSWDPMREKILDDIMRRREQRRG